MNLSNTVPLLLAALCITALGVSATTLETSLSTDPDEEINPDYEKLPIGQDDAVVLHEEIEGSEDDRSQAGAASDSDETDSDETTSAAAGGDSDSSRAESTGVGATPPSLLDRLLALLASLFRTLLTLAVILALVGFAVRYREHLLDALEALWTSGDEEPSREAAAEAWPSRDPSNAVERAWLALVREADPERPAVMTPAECAAAARDAGVDAATAETITDAFERVAYGGVPASAERDRVNEALGRLRARDGDESGDRPGIADGGGR